MKILAASRLRSSRNSTPVAVQAGFFEAIDKLKNVSSKAKHALKEDFKEQVHHVSEELGITKNAVILAFKEPKVSNMLKACGYSFATMYGALHMGHKVAEQGALHVIAHLTEHHVLHKAGHKAAHSKGVKMVDNIITKYPVLKKLTGPALAGVMLYGYTLTEPHKLGDWDLANVKRALSGEFGIQDFLKTPEAIYLGVHVATGKVLSLSALAENVGTLSIGLTCTAIAHSDHPKLKALASKVSSALNAMRSKKTPLTSLDVKPDTLKSAFGGEVPKIAVVDKEQGTKETKESTEDTSKETKDSKEAGGDWWDKMSDEAKERYKEQHPDTTLAYFFKFK